MDSSIASPEDFAAPLPAPSFTYASDELSRLARHVVRSIERVSGQPRIKRMYFDYQARRRPREQFWNDAVAALRLAVDLDRPAAEVLPATGPLVVVANHPFGVVDGVLLCWLVAQVRPDFRILTHRVLHQAPEVRDHVLPVDFAATPAALENNLRSRRAARAILDQGGVLILFPAGAVAYAPRLRGPAVDLPWGTLAAKLALAGCADVLPVFFAGQNSGLYQLAANLHQTLKYALLFHEVRNKIGARIAMRLGTPIPHRALRELGDSRAATGLLRAATEALNPMPCSRGPSGRLGLNRGP
ncbi:MAG: lysophospholipid acyltransferase family protein [Dongiaceae bacterium]